jgi:hypothetical protein
MGLPTVENYPTQLWRTQEREDAAKQLIQTGLKMLMYLKGIEPSEP